MVKRADKKDDGKLEFDSTGQVEDLTARGQTTRASEVEPLAIAIVPLTRWAP